MFLKAKTKRDILKKLNDYDINSASLFPDLDGLAQDIADNHFMLEGIKDVTIIRKAFEEYDKKK